jgi:hypothetical protein
MVSYVRVHIQSRNTFVNSSFADYRLEGIKFSHDTLHQLLRFNDPYEDRDMTSKDIEDSSSFLILETEDEACQKLMQEVASHLTGTHSEESAASAIRAISSLISSKARWMEEADFPKIRLAGASQKRLNFDTFAYLCDLFRRNVVANKADNGISCNSIPVINVDC